MINAHGNPRGINNRGIEEIAEYISIIDRAIGEDSEGRWSDIFQKHLLLNLT
jgi:hypothetical protein